jgi:hypothetical protein
MPVKPDVMDGVPSESGIYLAKDRNGWCAVEYYAESGSYYKTANELRLDEPEKLTWSERICPPESE